MTDPSARAVLPGEPALPWQPWGDYSDILVDRCSEGIARVAINRPQKRNAFRPRTVVELCDAFSRIREASDIGVVLFTGVGPAADGGFAFCAGGDQSVRGDGGYLDEDGLPRLNVLDLQRIIRSLPKVVIALVAGYAIGGGQVLHLLCDLSLAAENAVFGQTGRRWAASMAASVPVISPGWWGSARPGRSGFSAVNTALRTPWRWGW